jgi:hypothetical protein
MLDPPVTHWLAGLAACVGLMAASGACPLDLATAHESAWMDPDLLIRPDTSGSFSMPTHRPRHSGDPEMVWPVRPPASDDVSREASP